MDSILSKIFQSAGLAKIESDRGARQAELSKREEKLKRGIASWEFMVLLFPRQKGKTFTTKPESVFNPVRDFSAAASLPFALLRSFQPSIEVIKEQINY